MFGLFKQKPPLEPWEKAWTEDRLCIMAERFGLQALLDTPTLIEDYGGLPQVNNESDLGALLDFLTPWMRFDRPVHAQVFSDADAVSDISAAPLEPDSIPVRVHERLFSDRDALIAVIARQLAQFTLAETELAAEPWAGDLLPAYLGLGIFSANNTVRETGQSDGLSWWTSLQRGYLPARIFGYALALRDWVQGSSEPASWSSSLRPDAATTYEDGLRYLTKTSDSTFSRDMLTRPRSEATYSTIEGELEARSASRRIAAMWWLCRRTTEDSSPNERIVGLLNDCLRHKEPDVRSEAAIAFPRFSTSTDTMHEMLDALKDRNEKVRIGAAATLHAFAGKQDEGLVVEELTDALKDDVRLVVFNAARSLTAFGQSAKSALQPLLRRLRRSLNERNQGESLTLLNAIDAISTDTPDSLETFFGESDPEYLTESVELLQELREQRG